MPLTTLLVPIGGAFLLLLIVFQVLMGKRIIRLKGKLHTQVHRWIGYSIIAIAVAHGLYATHTFFAWPF
jgi:hypothetical protein